MTLFLIVFLACLAALYVMRQFDAYKIARTRHREYCHKQSLCYTWRWRIYVVAGRDARDCEQQREQATWWEKLSKSWVPTSPTQSEQDLLLEQSQDDELRQLKKDFDKWETK